MNFYPRFLHSFGEFVKFGMKEPNTMVLIICDFHKDWRKEGRTFLKS
jgi:hypothetical protein